MKILKSASKKIEELNIRSHLIPRETRWRSSMALHDHMRSTPGRFSSRLPGRRFAARPHFAIRTSCRASRRCGHRYGGAPIVRFGITMAGLGLVPDTELERRATTPRRLGVLICQLCLSLLSWRRPPQSRQAKPPPSSGCDLYLRRWSWSRGKSEENL
jgi:hypothetical protein